MCDWLSLARRWGKLDVIARLAYSGLAYDGWQSQPTGSTVESALLRALLRVSGESVRITALSRTDAFGVAGGEFLDERLLHLSVSRRWIQSSSNLAVK